MFVDALYQNSKFKIFLRLKPVFCAKKLCKFGKSRIDQTCKRATSDPWPWLPHCLHWSFIRIEIYLLLATDWTAYKTYSINLSNL